MAEGPFGATLPSRASRSVRPQGGDRKRNRWAATAATAVALSTGPAGAYCRTTTCDDVETCRTDRHGCRSEGVPLYWPGGKLTVWSSAEGSVIRGISGDVTERVVSEAFSSWMEATCESGFPPGLEVETPGQIPNLRATKDGINVVVFVDEEWPHQAAAVALTTVTFVAGTGRIVQTDTEVNSANYGLGVGPSIHEVDFLAIMTHEAGHHLGLDHTDVVGATMQPETEGFGFETLSSLELDDEAGICAIYPPSTVDDVGGGGLACTFSAKSGERRSASGLAALLLIAGARARRKRKLALHEAANRSAVAGGRHCGRALYRRAT